MTKTYNSDSIKVLSALQHMRLRKGVYIGECNDPRQLLSEVFDNAIDEVQAGYSKELVVNIDTKNNIYSVRDYGRGIPHGMKTLDNGEQKETLEVLLTVSNSGGKFNNDSYNYSSGLNGMGLTVTNALSKYMEVTSYRDGRYVNAITQPDDTVQINYGISDEHNGTLVMFSPDKQHFHSAKIPPEFIKDRCRVASALGFRARLIIDGVEQKTDASMFDLIKEENDKLSTYVNVQPIEVIATSAEKMKVALRYTSDTNDRYFGYTNLLSNYLGGTHVQELAKTVTACWIEFLDKHKNIKPAVDLHNSDYLVGLRGVCAVFIAHPEFSSQTKEKLVVNKKYFEELMSLFKARFLKYLEDNIVIAQQLIKRFEEYRIAQNNLLSRKEISSLIKINNDGEDNIRRRSVVSKLVECTSRKRKGTELFLCLAGDTKIKLLNGTDVTIEELVGKENLWAYSTNDQGQFIPAKIQRVFKTQDVDKLLMITFSDGSTIRCTPEHRFMDKDSLTWIEAKDLSIGQSMLTVKTKVVDGYTNVWVPMKYDKYNSKTKKKQGHWELVHKRVAKHLGIIEEYDGETIYNVHHKDHNRGNNDPSNLDRLTMNEHFKHHALYNIETGLCKEGFNNMSAESYERMRTGVYNRTPEGIQRQKTSVSESWEKDRHNPNRTWAKYNGTEKFWQDVERNKKLNSDRMKTRWANMSEEEREHERQLNREGTMIRKRIQCIHMGQQLLEQGYELTQENWKSIVWKNGWPSLNKAIEYFGSLEQFIEEIKNYNLKVVDIVELNYPSPIPVFCLTIDNPVHSFVLSNGLVTHNCEGDSAKGPFLFTRNQELQAVLPLRGKILNITNKSVKEAVKNAEICDIANAMGCGIGAACDASKSRYEHVILACDADPDGQQITCLLLSVFVNLFPDMVKQGRVYVSLPPLYCWGDSPKNYGWCNKVEDIPKTAKDVHRFKGLGEMQNEQLKYFLVDPQTRNTFKVSFPADVDEFNRILGSSEGKRDLLTELGIIERGE